MIEKITKWYLNLLICKNLSIRTFGKQKSFLDILISILLIICYKQKKETRKETNEMTG